MRSPAGAGEIGSSVELGLENEVLDRKMIFHCNRKK